MLTPSNRLCTWPLIVSGGSHAQGVQDARHDVDRVVVLVAQLALARRVAVAEGQEMMHGSAVPPLNSYRFHILNGVLNAIAQPLG